MAPSAFMDGQHVLWRLAELADLPPASFCFLDFFEALGIDQNSAAVHSGDGRWTDRFLH